MNYKKLYYKIIENKKQNPINEGYSENHHIVPSSLGGTDSPDNLVKLSTREHFICHYLLAKMYEKNSFEWYKMNHAFLQMKAGTITKNRYFNSRLYEALRGDFSSVMSFAQKGKNNSQHDTCWICHIENEVNKKIPKEDLELWVAEGWVKGRNKWKKKFSLCTICKNEFEVIDRATICSDECRKAKTIQRNIKSIGKYLKVSDRILLEALLKEKNVAQALRSVGLTGGANFTRAKKILAGVAKSVEPHGT